MNKLFIDNNEYVLDNYKGYIKISVNKLNLKLKGICKILILNNQSDLDIELLDNAKVIINFYDNKKNKGYKINIMQNNNTYLNLVDIFESTENIEESIIDNIKGNNNECNVFIRCLSLNNSTNILEQTNAFEGSCNNIANESVKGLVSGGNIKVLPNMEISTNNIEANHNVTISSYDAEELFYLNSKGLNNIDAKELLKKGFLFNLLDNEFRRVIIDE